MSDKKHFHKIGPTSLSIKAEYIIYLNNIDEASKHEFNEIVRDLYQIIEEHPRRLEKGKPHSYSMTIAPITSVMSYLNGIYECVMITFNALIDDNKKYQIYHMKYSLEIVKQLAIKIDAIAIDSKFAIDNNTEKSGSTLIIDKNETEEDENEKDI